MKKINIENKKILYYIKNCNIISLILCLFAFLFTYYYLLFFQKKILILIFLLFEASFSIISGSLISGIIIDNEIKK